MERTRRLSEVLNTEYKWKKLCDLLDVGKYWQELAIQINAPPNEVTKMQNIVLTNIHFSPSRHLLSTWQYTTEATVDKFMEIATIINHYEVRSLITEWTQSQTGNLPTNDNNSSEPVNFGRRDMSKVEKFYSTLEEARTFEKAFIIGLMQLLFLPKGQREIEKIPLLQTLIILETVLASTSKSSIKQQLDRAIYSNLEVVKGTYEKLQNVFNSMYHNMAEPLKIKTSFSWYGLLYGGAAVATESKNSLASKEMLKNQYIEILEALVDMTGQTSSNGAREIAYLEATLCNWIKKNNVTDASQLRSLLQEPGKSADNKSKEAIWNKMKAIVHFHGLKQELMKTAFIGFAGTHNAGKSRLINSLWGFDVMPKLFKSTKTLEPHKFSDTLAVIDFPGADDIDYSASKIFEQMNLAVMLWVLVFQIGDINDVAQKVVQIAVEHVPRNEDGEPCVLVLVNKADLREKEHGKMQDALAGSRKQVRETRQHYAKRLGLPLSCLFLTTAVPNAQCVEYGVLNPEGIKEKIIKKCSRFGLLSNPQFEHLLREYQHQ